MAAVRVPPSACSTSQSTVICTLPRASRSTTERSARPIRRWISSVRPLCLPVAAFFLLPGRHPFLDTGSAQHPRVAEADQHRALGVARVAAGQADLAELV